MRILYLECNMGAAGDMLTAALLELLPDPKAFIDEINSLGLPGVRVSMHPAQKCGISGTHITVTVHGQEEGEAHRHQEHCHGTMSAISEMINSLPVSEQVRDNALAVYTLIAQAEAKIHQKPVDQIHFHEIGAMDAVTDIVGFCLLVEKLAPDKIVASSVAVGSGFVRCAHGILPVPAPATAELLREVPVTSGEVQGELCTPTGAALLRYFVHQFIGLPKMRIQKIGYGCGKKDFEAANCVRAYLGQNDESLNDVYELCCNLDDMTAEAMGFAAELLLNNGALDVFTMPIFMKKNRPATLFTVLARAEDKERLTQLLLHHTTTFGVRQKRCSREILKTRKQLIKTPFGEIVVKIGTGDGVEKYKPEYEDVAEAAQKYGVTFDKVYKSVISGFEQNRSKETDQ